MAISLISSEWDGLGSRISNFVGSAHIAKRWSANLTLSWPEFAGATGVPPISRVFDLSRLQEDGIIIEEEGSDAKEIGLWTIFLLDVLMFIFPTLKRKMSWKFRIRLRNKLPFCWQRRRGVKASLAEISLRYIVDFEKSGPQGMLRTLAVHLRVGDMFFGPWQTFVPFEKYVPVIPVMRSELGDMGALVSDTRIRLTKNNFEVTELSEFKGQNGWKKAITDIGILANSERLLAAKLSGFSSYASNIGTTELVPVTNVISPSKARLILEKMLRSVPLEHVTDAARWVHARDIIWLVDRGRLRSQSKKFAEAAAKAAELDPNSPEVFIIFLSSTLRAGRNATLRTFENALSQMRDSPRSRSAHQHDGLLLVRCFVKLWNQEGLLSTFEKCNYEKVHQLRFRETLIAFEKGAGFLKIVTSFIFDWKNNPSLFHSTNLSERLVIRGILSAPVYNFFRRISGTFSQGRSKP